MKFTCVIDTSSYVNLSKDDCYAGRTLLKLLSEVVAIRFSSEVSRIEIPNHHNDLMPTTQERANQVYFLQKIKTYKEYEQRLFDSVSSRTSRNRGEKHNLAVIIDHYLDRKLKGLVYLTDDQRALRGCLNGVIDAFPFYQVWNSFDVALFLYIEHKVFSEDLAEAAIRDLNAIMATDNPQMDNKKTQKRIGIFKTYLKRIKRISKVIN